MSRFLCDAYAGLAPYVPGEQPQGGRIIKLNTNELPYPPPQSVIDAAKSEAGKANLYNDPDAALAVQAVAKGLGVPQNRVFLSNGSDEVLAFCFQGLCQNGAAFADLTYGFYPVYAEVYGVQASVVPLREDFTLAVEDYGTGHETIFIANPNAPTALALPLQVIERLVQSNLHRLVVIDEAYIKFGGETAVPLTEKYDNILVVGTFSKAYAMAGARLGYAVGCEALVDDLNRMKFSFNPYNVNRMTQAMAVAAMDEADYFAECVGRVCLTRERVAGELRGMGFVCADSSTNFLLCRHPQIGGQALQQALRQQGIIVRWFNQPRIKDYVRISIGTDEEMDAVLEAIHGILKK